MPNLLNNNFMLNILLPIVIIGVSAGLFFIKTSPIFDRVAEIEKTRLVFSNAQVNNKQFQDLLKQKNAIYNQVDGTSKVLLGKLLPDSIDNVRLIIDINQIASDNGMTIRNISVKSDDSGTIGPDSRPYGVATLNFSVSGSHQTFKNFLTALETSLRLVDVTSLSFSAGDRDQYEYNFEIKSYWLK